MKIIRVAAKLAAPIVLPIVVVLILIGCLVMCWGVFGDPQASITVVSCPPLTLNVKISRVNSLGISYYSETDKVYLWKIGGLDRSGGEVVYGVVPRGATQTIPRKGQPRPIRVGEQIIVGVGYQYDRIVPSMGGTSWLLEIEGEKKATIIGNANHIRKVPFVDVQVSRVDFPPLRFGLKDTNQNTEGLAGISVYSETDKEYLWDVDIDSQVLDEITYGVLPAKSKQNVPLQGPPRDAKALEKLLVEVRFKYEFGAGTSLLGDAASLWEVEIRGEKDIKLIRAHHNAKLPPREKKDNN